jgi:hypothetical protein
LFFLFFSSSLSSSPPFSRNSFALSRFRAMASSLLELRDSFYEVRMLALSPAPSWRARVTRYVRHVCPNLSEKRDPASRQLLPTQVSFLVRELNALLHYGVYDRNI